MHSATIAAIMISACRRGDLTEVRTLAQRGEDVNMTDRHGRTPLMYALDYRHSPVAEYLAELPDINVDICCTLGVTALHRACYNAGSDQVVKIIASKISSQGINKRGYNRTAIEIAVLREHTGAVQILGCVPALQWDMERLVEVARWGLVSFIHNTIHNTIQINIKQNLTLLC